ncbi:dynein light chain 1, cytoplasmic [Brachypodium distachyon]|uniref:dynein light chain 1, cytoplasmic n=1 Tax=Brachypodium distachyon TaxID=15368 RepID=UPI0001C71EEE|nr:dynein light chain 1, cytoplasmic [Brachypodium distachyon]|eukprot:XP_003566466.1 dynein light chain 1, cytoplasmic [Brachypodium distachyon]
MSDELKSRYAAAVAAAAASSDLAPYATMRASADADRRPNAVSATAALGSPPPASAGAAAASPTAPKIQLKSADMKEEMQKEAFDIARVAFEKHTMEKDIAEYIKKEFDKNHGPTWHCIVGRNFGSYVTHETNYFVYFYIDSKAVLLFKSG